MVEDGRSAPHGILLVVVVGLVVAVPMLLDSEAMLEWFADILSPIGLLLLPILLLLIIQFLSSDRRVSFSEILAVDEPELIHRVGGSPVGVALLLLLVMFLLYSRGTLFGSSDGDSGE